MPLRSAAGRGATLLRVAALCLGPATAWAQPGPSAIAPQPIAHASQHPGPLLVHQEGTGEIAKAYGTPRWAASVTAADKSFADLSILLIDGGSFLTPEVMRRFAEAVSSPRRYAAQIRADIVGRLSRASDAIDRAQAERELRELDRLRARGPLVRPVRLANGRRGYSAVLGFSRIDTTFATALPSPDGRYELLVSVALPFDRAGLGSRPAAAQYRQQLIGRPLDAVQAMALSVYRQLFPSRRPRSSLPLPSPLPFPLP